MRMTDTVLESTLGSEVTGPMPIKLRAPGDCVDRHSTEQSDTALCCRKNTNFGFYRMYVIL